MKTDTWDSGIRHVSMIDILWTLINFHNKRVFYSQVLETKVEENENLTKNEKT